jgi:hypothetical protein
MSHTRVILSNAKDLVRINRDSSSLRSSESQEPQIGADPFSPKRLERIERSEAMERLEP